MIQPNDGANGVLHLVSPDSLRSWFEHFVTLRDGDRIEWLGEQRQLSERQRQHACAMHAAAELTVLHSSHHTLLRDVALSNHLRQAASVALISQTPTAARIGTDKLEMKRQLQACAVPIIPWRDATGNVSAAHFAARHEGPFVVKLRNGTEGRALRLQPVAGAPLHEHEFEEPFVGGTEYSVVVLATGSRWLTLPTIWKGPTRRDLLPPYQRLRLCPAPDVSAEQDEELRALSLAATVAMSSEGFTEVELIIDRDGQARVIEVNPRIAGTMRMAAIACDQRIFDLPADGRIGGHLDAQRCVVEMPYHGEPWSDPDQLVYCTSRLTAGASTWSQLPAVVDRALDTSTAVAPQWRRSLDMALSELCVTP